MTHKYFSVTLALFLLSFTQFEVNAYYVRNETLFGETRLNVKTSGGVIHQIIKYNKVDLSASDYPVVITYINNSYSNCTNSLQINTPGCDTISGHITTDGRCYPLHHVNWCPGGSKPNNAKKSMPKK